MPDETGTGPDPARSPGQSAARINSFTDAVLAIAMTLLVFDIPRPAGAAFDVGNGKDASKSRAFGNLGNFLVHQHQSFLALLLAFLILWVVWREHHQLFDQFNRVSPAMTGWHFPLLLLSALLPYATSVFGHYSDNPMAALLYGANVTALLLCRTIIQTQALRDGVLDDQADQERYKSELIVSWVVTGYWLVSLTLVWWTPWSEIP